MNSNLDIPIAKESLRVLHAEDSDDCAVLVRRAMKRAGFSRAPVRALDGESAIAHLSRGSEQERPHVILLDLHMPMKDGFEVLEWLRGQPNYQATPVVMLTSSQEAEDIERARRLGATRFLQKDGTYRSVVQTLEALLAESGCRQESPEEAAMG